VTAGQFIWAGVVAGRDTADQKLIVSLFNELDSALTELQRSNIALDTC
jgi:hypothetical protein